MRNYFFLFALLLSIVSLAQTSTENYVHSVDYRTETETSGSIDDNKIDRISYYDGLGRNIQQINARAGGAQEDHVVFNVYDENGVIPEVYLPWVSTSGTSSLDKYDSSNIVSDLDAFYDYRFGPNSSPYSQSVFEQSPRLRVLEAGFPGMDWQIGPNPNSNHSLRMDYDVNDTSDNVAYLQVSFVANDYHDPQLAESPTNQNNANNFYSTGALLKQITKNENWQPSDGDNNTVVEFTDKRGFVVLKRAFESGESLDTYYVYDDLGNLTYVMSPEASSQMLNSSGRLVSGYQQLMDKLGYQYKYDYRNRLFEKKLPGIEPQYIIYDNLDRPILTQDGNQRNNGDNLWLFTKYDEIGRVIYTGVYDSPDVRSVMETKAKNDTVVNEFRIGQQIFVGGTYIFYTSAAYPQLTPTSEVLTISYFDNYGIPSNGLVVPSNVYGKQTNPQPMGLPTVSWVKILDTNHWITSVSGYDDKSRVVYLSSYNERLETTDEIKTQFDFPGNVLETATLHQKTSANDIEIIDSYFYDHMNRLLSHKQKIDDEPVQVISENLYDDLGRLISKSVGGETLMDGYTGIENAEINIDGDIYKTESTSAWDAGAKTRGEVVDQGGVRVTIPSDSPATFRFGFNKTNTFQLGWGNFDFGLEFSMIPGQQGPTTIVKTIINGGISLSDIADYEEGDIFEIFRDENDLVTFTKISSATGAASVIFSLIDSNPSTMIGKIGLLSPSSEAHGFELFASSVDRKLQDISYDYNIRGWLTRMNFVGEAMDGRNTDLFAFEIKYNDPYSGQADPLYNGNIAQTLWQTRNDGRVRRYDYKFDDLNRIIEAKSYKDGILNNNHNLSGVNYDKNGNILVLTRRGFNEASTPMNGIWDDLFYSYDGNMLQSVTDTAGTSHKQFGFNDGNTTGNDYDYDDNGNMILDNNKNITGITYNHLNLPTQINFNNAGQTGSIVYTYDATGVKISKSVLDYGSSTDVVTDYAGNFIYLDGELQFFSHPEGYVEPVANTTKSVKGMSGGTITYSSYSYVFQYKDHLGNVRLSYADADKSGSIDLGEIIEESNYYPFGLEHKGYNNIATGGNDLAQAYKFGGKELNSELSLEWYDFGARNYDAALGRWMNIDPLAFRMMTHSPYSYSFNSPIYYSDPNGMQPLALKRFKETGSTDAFGTIFSTSTSIDYSSDSNNDVSNNGCPRPPCNPVETSIAGTPVVSDIGGFGNNDGYSYTDGVQELEPVLIQQPRRINFANMTDNEAGQIAISWFEFLYSVKGYNGINQRQFRVSDVIDDQYDNGKDIVAVLGGGEDSHEVIFKVDGEIVEFELVSKSFVSATKKGDPAVFYSAHIRGVDAEIREMSGLITDYAIRVHNGQDNTLMVIRTSNHAVFKKLWSRIKGENQIFIPSNTNFKD